MRVKITWHARQKKKKIGRERLKLYPSDIKLYPSFGKWLYIWFLHARCKIVQVHRFCDFSSWFVEVRRDLLVETRQLRQLRVSLGGNVASTWHLAATCGQVLLPAFTFILSQPLMAPCALNGGIPCLLSATSSIRSVLHAGCCVYEVEARE